MTPTRMRRRLQSRNDTRDLVGLAPATLARALEALADRNVGDHELDALVADAQAWASLEGRLRATGHRLESVVRWDDWTATVEAVAPSTGVTVLARVLRPEHRGSESRRRLARHARALQADPELQAQFHDGDHPAIVAPLPGGPLLDGPIPSEPLCLRATVRVLGDLIRREGMGLGSLDPDRRELRLSTDGARVVSLQLGPEPTHIRSLADDLAEALPADPIEVALRGASELPPANVHELSSAVLSGLAQHLADLRHRLVQRWRVRRHDQDRARLRAAISRLERYPPPSGHAAVGVDMDGQTTTVRGDGQTLTWGPQAGPQLAILSEQGLHPRTARRMLRARASAPSSPRLNEEVGGDPEYAERAGRWVAGALALRTLHKLLAIPTDGPTISPDDRA
ncbi:MAG: hypothetical protein AB8H79_01870 [Myxococcota bacterium]